MRKASPDSLRFRPIGKDIPVYSRSNINQWISFRVCNATSEPSLFLTARAPNVPLLILYRGGQEIYRAVQYASPLPKDPKMTWILWPTSG